MSTTRALPGDQIIPAPEVQFDRVTTFAATPEQVWPWLVQLGKGRAGWYLPALAERLLPRKRRALRAIDPALQDVAVGDRIADWGPRDPHFTVRQIDPPHALVLHMARRRLRRRPALIATWALVLDQPSADRPTRLHARLRVEHVGLPLPGAALHRFALPLVDVADRAITVAMFRGLAERVELHR